MTSVLWTTQASEDLAAIFAYIAQDSEHYARLTIRELIAATARLKAFPELGRVVPELERGDIREVIWRSYRLVYQYLVTANEIRVLMVFRAERLFQVPTVLG